MPKLPVPTRSSRYTWISSGAARAPVLRHRQMTSRIGVRRRMGPVYMSGDGLGNLTSSEHGYLPEMQLSASAEGCGSLSGMSALRHRIRQIWEVPPAGHDGTGAGGEPRRAGG